MYATIDLHFSSIVHRDRLLAGLTPSSVLQETIDQTVFRVEPGPARAAIYSSLTRSTAVLIIPTGDQGCQVHIESILARGSVAELKDAVAKTLRSILDASKNSKQKVDDVEVTIYAEDNRVTIGRKAGALAHLQKRLRETIFGDLLFAVAPPLATFLAGGGTKQVLVTLLGACLAIVVWFFVEVRRKAGEVSYEDV